MANDHSIPWSQIILKAFLGLVMACALGLTATVPAFAQEIVAIAAGGPAQSNSSGGDYSFVADEDFSGGGDNSPVTATINLTQPGANAAPMGVYQHGRAGAFTYTIPGLTAGSTYTVLLHFAETYFTAAGEREFDVAINGTSVLTNLDIYATVGKDAALLETFTATANSSGQIVIAFTLGAANQPVVMGIEIRSTSSCTTVPSAPAGLAATASSSSVIGLSWTAVTPPANCTISSYSVYRSTTSGFTPGSGNLIASGVTGTSYSNTGLAASTTYYYVVEAVDADGSSAASAQASATTSAASCSTVPSAPTGLTATASSSSAIALSWTAVTPPANCTISSYSVYRSTTSGFTPGSGNLITSGLTGTSYSNTGLTASTTYYYVVEALDSFGTSAASAQATATTAAASSGTSIVSINAGGPAESNSGGGDNSFVADEDYGTGGTTYAVTNPITIPANIATIAAPAAVYQSARQGVVTYTIPGLSAGTSYTVRLHFAELYFSAAGAREFDVAINGTAVLTNFDIYATAGANYTAVVEQYIATANSSGDIVIAFTGGAANQPMFNGIEILGNSAICAAVPSAPTGLTATASSSSMIGLTWNAVTPPANCSSISYSVYSSTTSGFTPSSTNLIVSGVTGTSYSNTGLAASTTYYYKVEAVDLYGTSASSAQAQATTPAGSGCDSVPPTGPTNLTATASSSSVIGLSWTAAPANPPCTITSYSVYRSTTNGFTAGSGNLIASGVTGTSYSNTGLAASTTYYYVVEALDSFGASAASAQASATTQSGGASCTTVPSAPTGLTATASSSSAIGLSWTAVTPPANCTISSYSVYESTTSGFTPSASNLIASGLTTTSYSSTGLSASTTYYYVVEAVDADGSSPASAQASAETSAASSGTSIVSINAGGPAESNSSGGDNSFVADEDYNTGTTTYSVTNTITIPASVASTAAPAAVYQSARQGTVTYTIPGLTAGTSYTVRLHFAELYFSAAGDRVFNVAINGTTVLTNFDIYATAGANYTAVVEQFTATANSSGDIVIAFTNGTIDQPMINGVEVLGSSTSCSTVPSAPTGLTATASSSSAISLSWTAVTPPANCSISSYNVYRSTTSGFTASSSNLIASGVTGTTYSNTGLAASTTYYYLVEAVDADGTSTSSSQASAETSPASCTTVPSAPTGLTATASSSSVISLGWTAVTPPANCTISSYSVYRSTTSGFTPGASNLIASGVTTASYSNTGLAASTTYYYVVEALDADGTSAASAQAAATTQAASGAEIVAIACGGPAESNSGGGDYSFVADEDFSGGGDNSPVTATINLTQPGANAAPMGVYQHGRAGVFTYTIPGLTAGSTYTVLLHFAETYFTAAGDREFNVAINGTTVLTNLDIYGTVGKDAALLETFTATANSSGDIVIAFTDGAANQPVVMGIEIR